VFLCPVLSAQITTLASVNTTGVQGNGKSYIPAISADGRYVAFNSLAYNLVLGDLNGHYDVFVRDLHTGVTERVSLDSTGAEGDDDSGSGISNDVSGNNLSVSSDGRFVAFGSKATNLVAGDTNGVSDVFVRDRQTGLTERVSVSSGGVQGNSISGAPSISPDGRYVAFISYSSNLAPSGTSAFPKIFVRDRRNGTTELVSTDSNGIEGNNDSIEPSISADGRYVAFQSLADNLVPGDTIGSFDIFVHDRQTGTTERVSVGLNQTQADNHSGVDGGGISISSDGRFVVFDSRATNLVRGDTNGATDVFVYDRWIGVTERVSVDSTGGQGNGLSEGSSLSADGRYVTFNSFANNLVLGDSNNDSDVFVHDRRTGTTERMSVDSSGAQGDLASNLGDPTISADGRYVGLGSSATNLVVGDMNGEVDIFVRDRVGTSFATLCDPGVGSVIVCPCSNSPSGPGRGCNNSSSSGGATVSATGNTYLSSDSLVFATSGENPTATSIVLQGDAVTPIGVVFGQGVRCVSGSPSRLYTKTAVAGSITAPNFGAGDPTVSARSAALGDTILAGQSRWYLVYYRDPIVLGGCPSGSTFNATQTGRIDWSL
jgi:Tol biopolymer transport system component